MCVVSMIGDHYGERIPQQYPWVVQPNVNTNPLYSPVTREEFNSLKRDIEEMKALLLRAKQYDEEHGEPDCEMEEKVEMLKRVAEMVGVDLYEVFGD
jgi:hypothetical protein